MGSLPMGLPNLGVLTLAGATAIQQAIASMGLGATGTVYYLDVVNGNDGNDGKTPAKAVASLAVGYALLVSGKNDVLVIIGDGSTTASVRLTANFTWAKNACHLVGICAPSMLSHRARIAPKAATAAYANFFTVSGNGCIFQNLSFWHGFDTGIAAEICLTVSGQRNAFLNCHFEGMGDTTGATDTGSRVLYITGGENYFGHCTIGIDTVTRTGANASVQVASGAARNMFEDCLFPVRSSDGLQYFYYAAAAAAHDRFTLFKGCNFISAVGSGGTAIAEAFKLAASSGGIVAFDNNSGLYGVTAIGDATSKGQIYVSGGTATNGVKGVVAT